MINGGFDSQSFAKSYSDNHIEATETIVVESPSRSYSPYLIEYHEETNSFSYNDHWIQVDHAENNCCEEIEIKCNVIASEMSHESTSAISPQPIVCDQSKKFSEEIKPSELHTLPVVEVTAHDHVPEVSFQQQQHSIQFAQQFLDLYQTLNYPFPLFSTKFTAEGKSGCG